MNQPDPTDHALATIASILEHSEPHRLAERPAIEESPVTLAPEQADGYFKVGPGPMEAIRFRWTVRHGDDGAYYVDETIGQNSVPAISGPMSLDAAVRMVDQRESAARLRFEELRSEMASRSEAALLARSEAGES
ncbi:hypothetical protein [Bradyrhizobium sp. NP1]|uniref:hypothetical protein n=1 Tax=Bradyrhizobium sp. NP1 TaxID=3049772 RepID=UPI0025A68A5E|nr:hypothetical protein [Bradyrhizobium sp. NP1]WJR74890.1 hypothetical protein QOU61_18860 [Bradyrhizobium sp. NP1]